MRIYAALCCTLLIAALAFGQGDVPKRDYVPDPDTAIKIAEAVLIPVYGKNQIESERPFAAELKGDVWVVSGTLHCPDGKGGITTHCDGGVATVRISKVDARVVSMIHYK
jgi:hypothetical protein